jgi:hypothetical protein
LYCTAHKEAWSCWDIIACNACCAMASPLLKYGIYLCHHFRLFHSTDNRHSTPDYCFVYLTSLRLLSLNDSFRILVAFCSETSFGYTSTNCFLNHDFTTHHDSLLHFRPQALSNNVISIMRQCTNVLSVPPTQTN